MRRSILEGVEVTRERRSYVVVSGPAASGKTTLARPLADELGLPLLAKDTIKVALFGVLPVLDIETARLVGRAAVSVPLAVAAEGGFGAVLESVWYRSQAIAELRRLDGSLVEVFCRCDRAILEARYATRSGKRPVGYVPEHRDPTELWTSETTEPVAGGWPVIEVDTNRSVDVAALVRRVKEVAS